MTLIFKSSAAATESCQPAPAASHTVRLLIVVYYNII